MKKIKVEHYSEVWECGEPGCCTEWYEISTFYYEDKKYQYTSGSTTDNWNQFLIEVIGMEIEEEWADNPNDVV